MRFGSALAIAAFVIAALVAPPPSGAEETGRARLVGVFPWVSEETWFGGWSGIELSRDGRKMTLVNDRGLVLRARIEREDGRITGISGIRKWHLKGNDGRVLTGLVDDSEGLAETADGRLFISFEGVARLSRYDRPGQRPVPLRRPREFSGFGKNKALEALAIDGAGRLFTIPERVERDGTLKVFVLEGTRWTIPFTLPGTPDFLPVGADFGPDGRFYLLERAWSALGFRARVRRWDITGDRAENGELLLETTTGTHDNLEGLAVWRDDEGRIRLTMIADDNFLAVQRTVIVEYAVQE